MRRIELKRKDSKPLYCWAEAVSAWTAATENPAEMTDIWIGGKLFTLQMSILEVDELLTEATK